jgi:hypothetical protein
MAKRKELKEPDRYEYAKQRGIEPYTVRVCPQSRNGCQFMGLYPEVEEHRTEAHDKPRGIELHAQYYNGITNHGAQIVLIDPRVLRATRREASTGWGGSVRWNEDHVLLEAEDVDSVAPRMVSVYMSKEDAKRLGERLIELSR